MGGAPAPEVTAALEEGLRLYRGGRPWEAHQAWETAWRALSGPERRWVQGLIMLAGAAHHLSRGRRSEARRLLLAAAERLEPAPDPPLLAVAPDPAGRARAAARRGGDGPPAVDL